MHLEPIQKFYIIVNTRIAKEEGTCCQAPKRQLKHDGTGPLELCSPLYHLMKNVTIKIRSVIVKYGIKRARLQNKN